MEYVKNRICELRWLLGRFQLNPLHAKFLESFCHTDMTQVVEILPQVRQELIQST